MTLATITQAANDPDLVARVRAAAQREVVYNPELAESTFGKQLQQGVANIQALMYPVAIDTEAQYETAVNSGRGAPGHDVDIITDAQLTSAVSVHWPYTDAERGGGGWLESIDPGTAVVGGADVTLHVHGTGFTAFSEILFNNDTLETTFVSSTELTAVVTPSTATAGPVPVSVKGGSGSAEFTFTE